jgi:SAM-dependent methyltransferase
MFRESLKWLLFPGLNLHARLRTRALPEHFLKSSNGRQFTVLDAGCGNGSLAYQSYLRGNRVVGVSIKDEIERNRRLFNEYLGIPEDRLRFQEFNLYHIADIGMMFDEIICTEVMEHIRGDEQVCRGFFQILRPGGILHLTCPNADHPYHKAYPLDPQETGGHVRPGYTEASYRALLEPIGFEVSAPVGLGGPIRQACNVPITRVQELGGLALGLPTFLLLAPWAVLEGTSGKVPFSLYVRATRPRD